MEETKLAAYYDELTKKGGAAAKFKQGLGFSDNQSAAGAVPEKGSALPSTSSSFLSSFVKSSTANTTDTDIQHQSELHSIKNKLSKKSNSKPRVSDRDDNPESKVRDRDARSRRRSRSRSRSTDRKSRLRSRSSDRKSRQRSRSSDRKSRQRSRSSDRKSRRRSRSNDSKCRRRSRSYDRRSNDSKSRYEYRASGRDEERSRRGSRSRSLSPVPRERRRERNERNVGCVEKNKGGSSDSGRGVTERNAKVNYAQLIEGYDQMTPAERVKAKMKLQLIETAEKDATNGTGSGWERFEFNKDAPLDDEEIEAAEDDAKLVKHIGQSFRFSAVEARKEEKIKAAHDNAMFGAPKAEISIATNHKAEEDTYNTESSKTDVTSLMSEKVLAKQPGSWRDRVRKV